MAHVLFYSLVSLSVIGIIIDLLCSVKIIIDKIKTSKYTKNLCIFLIIYFLLSIFWLKFYDFIPASTIKKIGSLILGLGVIIAPTILLVGIPGFVVKFERNKNAFKLSLIGLFGLLCSITCWIVLKCYEF